MTPNIRSLACLILIAIFPFNGQGQDECVRTTNEKPRDILRNFPFNQAKTIKVVSFKSNKEDIVYEIPKINGQIDIERLLEIKSLNKRNKFKLLDLLVNVNYAPNKELKPSNDSIEVREVDVMACYTPRHAILFEDDYGQVFSYVEICIECLRFKAYPDNINIGDFCEEKYKLLEDFFRRIGIVYGISRNGLPFFDE